MQKLICKKCGNNITKGSKSGLCSKCSQKERYKDFKEREKLSISNSGSKNGNYKDGRTLKKYYCKCGNEIGYYSFHYGSKMCRSCSHLGNKHTKETIEIMREVKVGKFNPNFAKLITKETRVKMSLSHIGKKQSKATIEKVRQVHFGKKRTKKSRENMSKAQNKRFQDPKERKKMSLAQGGTGIPHENNTYPTEFTSILRKKIRERDNYTCQCCGMSQEQHFKKYNRDLEVHHIDHDRMNCSKDNLITLCKQCNLNANYNVDYWYTYYSYKIENNILLIV